MEDVIRQVPRQLAYCASGAVLGVITFALVGALLVPGVIVSGSVIGTVLGLAMVVTALRLARGFGALQRRLLAWLVGRRVPAPPRFEPGSGPLGRVDRRLRDRAGWRAVGSAAVRLPVAVAQGYTVFVFVDGLVNLVHAVVWAFREHPARLAGLSPLPFGDFDIRSWPGALFAMLVGAACLAVTPWLARGVIAADGWLIRVLLGPGELTERVAQLERSRAQAVDDSAAALRRVERDLHDGAQVRLAALALNLGMAQDKAQAGEPDMAAIRELLTAASGNAADALAELRDLARGIHPPALDNGLDDALASLAASSAIPVAVHARIGRRPTPAIEAIAYFCAAELLANANKYSFANQIEIFIEAERGRVLRLTVSDDGVGGAREASGSGLAGLAQRVSTVDGELDVSSPPGGPTTVTVELPLRA